MVGMPGFDWKHGVDSGEEPLSKRFGGKFSIWPETGKVFWQITFPQWVGSFLDVTVHLRGGSQRLGDVVDVAVSILRATIFKTNCSLTARSLMDTQQMETVFPLLLSLLDERDGAARAVVVLIAEYCSINADGQCLQEVFRRLTAKKIVQRRNAIDVISELMHISSESKNSMSLSIQQDIAKKLLDCLADDEPVICVQASKLVATCDPLLILSELVRLVYNPYERVRKSASDTLVEVLKCHNQNPEVIVMLIDNLSKLCQSSEHANPGRGEVEGSKFDSDQLLKLIPHWSKSVQDWSVFIEPILNKMFTEPSNAVIVRFLSYISEDLAEARDLLLGRVLLYMQGQNEIKDTHNNKWDESIELKNSLFGRLCPLLIIRLLPLKVFNDLSSTAMYGQLLNVDALHVSAKELKEDFNEHGSCSIAAMLVTRAFHKFEYEDVRKLAAELCGRIHPQVLYPIIRSLLAAATSSRDILKMKACLFALCTSLVLRGSDSVHHPVLFEIRKILDMILLWPSVNGDEVSKAQHGCIDCLALMVCAELQTPDSFEECSKKRISISKYKNSTGEGASKNSVLSYVIQNLTNVRKESILSDDLDGHSFFSNSFSDVVVESRAVVPFSFHLCMANVLISACQKISSSGKDLLAERILPVLIRTAEVMQDSEVRAASIQVLFSAVYHLKSAVLPYSCDLLKLSVKALKKGSPEEKMASVKLMASLLASEDVLVTNISGGLLEARSALSNICLTDPSMELRQVCKELLICITSPI
ncbi:Arm repeat superfamily protein [Thalictrum thalictroides]|uniref:Arm repeat superfamily protein n=1 Tax=Thalictrum thalictroides TaxID=46969 RepID=A0A7J6UT54_THATH|nr:Arm repeat superfamily protein [Thalictrum thalictroides]